MKTTPLVSVIVNNYNYAHFLADAIDSALAQAYAPLEVVVVDDGSTDESRDVIAGYGDRVIPVFKENGGQASAFNAGFAASRGDVVIFVDADDMLLPHTVATAVSLFSPAVVKVHWPLWEIDRDGARTGIIHPSRTLDAGDLREKSVVEGPLVGGSPPTSGNAWSRTLLQQILPIPEEEFRINADGYLFTLSWIYGEVRAIPEPLGHYRVHGANHFASKTVEERRVRHLEKFVHQCTALERHLRASGVEPRPVVWRARKGIYDAEVRAATTEELSRCIGADTPFILMDDNQWSDPTAASSIPGRSIPFLERDGVYWGRPADDATAIRELDRLRDAGAELLVVPWFAFWWLTSYPTFGQYITDTCSLAESNAFFTLYDLRCALPK